MSSTNLQSCWAFDIDGCLADTREAVALSYKMAGVELPEEAWGISWKIWLPAIVGKNAPSVHFEKQKHYELLLESGAADPLPGAHLAQALLTASRPVYFVTAASERSARSVLRSVGLDASLLAGWELSPSERTERLRDIAAVNPGASMFTYFDDREEGAKIAADAGWLFVHAKWTP